MGRERERLACAGFLGGGGTRGKAGEHKAGEYASGGSVGLRYLCVCEGGRVCAASPSCSNAKLQYMPCCGPRGGGEIGQVNRNTRKQMIMNSVRCMGEGGR